MVESRSSHFICSHYYIFLLQFQAFDFRITSRNEPFLQLFHCLYVYPLSVSMTRKRNLFIRVELRKDDVDIRRPPLEVYLCYMLLPSLISRPDLSIRFLFIRQCIQGSQILHFKSVRRLKLLLELGLLAIMMKLKSRCLLYGPLRTTFCSLSFMLTFKQKLNLPSL